MAVWKREWYATTSSEGMYEDGKERDKNRREGDEKMYEGPVVARDGGREGEVPKEIEAMWKANS